MGITAIVLFTTMMGFTTQDIVSETNYVEVPFRYICTKTGGEWVNLHQPHAACVNQDDGWLNPKDGEV